VEILIDRMSRTDPSPLGNSFRCLHKFDLVFLKRDNSPVQVGDLGQFALDLVDFTAELASEFLLGCSIKLAEISTYFFEIPLQLLYGVEFLAKKPLFLGKIVQDGFLAIFIKSFPVIRDLYVKFNSE
jgi:hypothetical protein